LLAHHPEQDQSRRRTFCVEVERKKMPDQEEDPARPIGPKVRVQTGRFRPISDRYPQVSADQQEQGNSHCDLRIDVFLSKAWNPKSHTATAHSLFVEAFNKAKLRKRLMAGGVSSDQTDAWIDDKKYPVLASDYVNWTTLPAEYLYKGLNDALQEIADQVLPEVGPNITEWTRIKKSE
jgi:hypothetical protein